MRFKLPMEGVIATKPYEKKVGDHEVEQHIEIQYMGGAVDVLVSPAFLREIKLNVLGTAIVEGEFVSNAEIWKSKDGRQGAFVETPFKVEKLIGFTPVGGSPIPTLSGADKK